MEWNQYLNIAKTLENKLQHNIDSFSVVAQKINSDFLCDEENAALLGTSDEEQLMRDIEQDLTELSGVITKMKAHIASTTSSSGQHINKNALLKRYNEIYYDFTNEFSNTTTAIKRKRTSMELFQQSQRSPTGGRSLSSGSLNNAGGSESNVDPSMASLLRERSGITGSMRAIQEVMSQAFEARNSLTNQRSILSGADGGLSSITANSPTLHRLMDGIQRKNTKENIVLTIFVSLLLCFIIWWVFLR